VQAQTSGAASAGVLADSTGSATAPGENSRAERSGDILRRMRKG
jgi:hypothetical protein